MPSGLVEVAAGALARGSPALEVLLDPGSQIGIYAINAVSEMTDIPITTLRYWERRYAVVKPFRTAGGHRLYSQLDVERLRFLKAKIDDGLQAGAAHRLLEYELDKVGGVAREAARRGAKE